MFAGVAQSFWRSRCYSTDCTPCYGHYSNWFWQEALVPSDAAGVCMQAHVWEMCVCVCICMCTCEAAIRGAAPEWPGTLWTLQRLCWHQNMGIVGGATSLSKAGGEHRRKWRGASNIQTQVRNIWAAPRVRPVGCRLVGKTDPCSLQAPSQREEEPAPQAGAQTQESFKGNARCGALAAVSPTAFNTHPDLIKPTSRRKSPCQINYVIPNWCQ